MSWDTTWEEVYQRQPWGKYPGEDLIRFVARNFYRMPDRGAVKILEVGCGPGANLWYMAREGFSVYGIDGSRTAIEMARGRLDAECPGWKGQLWCADLRELPIEDARMDGVIDNEAACCNPFEESGQIYSEMARVTKPGGKLFSRTFASGCWGDGTGEPLGRDAWRVAAGPLQGKGLARFTRREDIAGLMGGFRIEEVELLTRTMAGGTHEVREWLITAVKP